MKNYDKLLHALISLMLFVIIWGFGSFWTEYSHKIAISTVFIVALLKELNDIFWVIPKFKTSNVREFSKLDFAFGFFPAFLIYLIIELTMI